MSEISAFAAYKTLRVKKPKSGAKLSKRKADVLNSSTETKKPIKKKKIKAKPERTPKNSHAEADNSYYSSTDLDSSNNNVQLSNVTKKVSVKKLNKKKKQKISKTSNESNTDTNLDETPKDNDVDNLVDNENLDESSNCELEISTKSLKGILVKEKEKSIDDPNYAIDGKDSVENGEQLFSWMVFPSESAQFFRKTWEKHPLIIKRHCPTYYSTLLSSEDIDKTLRRKHLHYTKNIDITSYTDGERETHNSTGRAHAPVVWDYYQNGCSVRILNPQTFFPKIHTLNATLQEFFGCMVGANVYLTPAGTQGFAPHYDDIEAFVLQVEGRKRWRLYPPSRPVDVLPRYSSGNFKEEDLGEPLAEYTLESGDMLYFPRGTIHQANALEDSHSLHITLSVYQKTSWADLLEKLLPAALNSAVEENFQFRRGLPLHYLSYMGVAHSDETSKDRTQFVQTLQNLIGELFKHAPIDAAVDQLGKGFIHDSLPPVVRPEERGMSVYGDGELLKEGRVTNQAEIGLDTRVKLLRYNCLRLVREDDGLRIYYSVSNSLEYHAEELQFLEINETLAPAVDALIKQYPYYIAVEELPLDKDSDKVQVVGDLWETGLILTEEPLGYTSD